MMVPFESLFEGVDWQAGEHTFTDVAIRMAPHLETPVGDVHLHLVRHDGRVVWVVRHGKGKLCGTPRCRKVNIYAIVGI
jgi:hypothetical protein